ncbi:hypothetical protein DY000_02021701 [Brassica cretica]|uniref:Uncharacterized protein n=1 Tax=Brassica cretica TaxID=69181 RepID=A0ABQ7EAI8_BRACR|nr:hypothetical protein DY000_02021701 [Brassica cretica]
MPKMTIVEMRNAGDDDGGDVKRRNRRGPRYCGSFGLVNFGHGPMWGGSTRVCGAFETRVSSSPETFGVLLTDKKESTTGASLLPRSTTIASLLPRSSSSIYHCSFTSSSIYHQLPSTQVNEKKRTNEDSIFTIRGPDRKAYVASGAGLDRGLGTAGYGGLTRKDPPEIETAAGRATAGRVVPIAIPTDVSSPQPFSESFLKRTNLAREIKRMTLRNISVYVY